MPPSLDALSNAARLRQSPGRSNFANYEDIFAGPEAGYVPSAHEMFTGRENADQAATALGAGPAISALRRAFDNQQLMQTQGLLARDASLKSGLPQGIARQENAFANELGDINSEAEAGREFLPFASQLHNRNVGETMDKVNLQYLLPAQTKAQGDLAAAQATSAGRANAEQVKASSLPLRGLFDALSAIITKTGQPPDEQTLATLRAQFGVK